MKAQTVVRSVLPQLWQALPLVLRRRIVWLTHATRTVGVSAVLIDEQGNFLLLRHRYREWSDWTFPGGLVNAGEGLESALRREMLEETGLNIDVVRVISAKISPPQHIDVCYVARVVSGELALDGNEIVEGHFFPRDVLSDLLTPAQLETIALAIGCFQDRP
jgi:ADP-ribose pyrophosphatase YjhB (NUDIX family)